MSRLVSNDPQDEPLDTSAVCDGCGRRVDERELVNMTTEHGEGAFCERCRDDDHAGDEHAMERRREDYDNRKVDEYRDGKP